MPLLVYFFPFLPPLSFGRGAGGEASISDCFGFPASGYRYSNTGVLSTQVGKEIDCWSSSARGGGSSNGSYLNLNGANVNPLNGTNRSYGLSVRCVQELTKIIDISHKGDGREGFYSAIT